MHISLPVLLLAVLVSLLTILISAFIPARKAAKSPVMECIRQTGEIKVSAKAVKTSAVSQKLLGLEGTLALKSFRRNKRQYRSIILSLVLSIVLFITTSTFTDCFRRISDEEKGMTDYDIGFASLEMSDGDLRTFWKTLKTTRGIRYSICRGAAWGLGSRRYC